MPKDLHELPKLRDSISYLYFEHAVIEQEDSSIVVIQESGRIPVPISSVTCLLLGPGTRVTHAAIKAMAENGCIADLYKSETSIPAAFETVSAKYADPDRKLRAAMRQKILRADVLKRVADDIAWIFDVPLREEQDNQSEVGKLWDGSGEINGGKNHGGGDPGW